VRLVVEVQVPLDDDPGAAFAVEQGCDGDVEITVYDATTEPPALIGSGRAPGGCDGSSIVTTSAVETGETTTTSTSPTSATTTGTTAPTTTTTATTSTTTVATTTTTSLATTTTLGWVAVPSLVGKTRTQAIAELEALGLAYSEERSCFEEGVTDEVVFQGPLPGSLMRPGGGEGSVVFFGSQFATGCSNVLVAGVVGLTQGDAIATLEGNGFVVAVNEGCHGEATPGVVVSQSPSVGTSVPQGWTVRIDVQASGCG
jgi:hypothetical protein